MAVRTCSSIKRRKRKDKNIISVAMLSLSIVLAALILKPGSAVPKAVEAERQIVGEFDTVNLPVPSAYVPTGTRLKDIKFREVAFPRHQVPKNAIDDISPHLEAVTIAPLPANLPIFAANFTLAGTRSNPVIERIPTGMRAMTVRVDATSAVEGWATSGSIVDVLLVQNAQTKVIAEKVKIISAERSLEPKEGTSEEAIPRTVTLLVTQEQCLAINTAIPLGKIAFALRGQSDDGIWNDTTYTSNQLNGTVASSSGVTGVSGFASVKDDQGREKKFALSDGRWIRSQIETSDQVVTE